MGGGTAYTHALEARVELRGVTVGSTTRRSVSRVGTVRGSGGTGAVRGTGPLGEAGTPEASDKNGDEAQSK